MDLDMIKCVVVGDSCSGKTALLEAFANGNPCDDSTKYFPTVINHYEAITLYEDSEVTLALFDTAGTPNALRVRKCLYPQTKVILVTFSIFDPKSFENVRYKWVPEIKAKCPGVPWILVGTHADLRANNTALLVLKTLQSKHPVCTETAQATAQELQASGYFECGSSTMQGIVPIFHEAIGVARTYELKCLQREYEKEQDRLHFGSDSKRASTASSSSLGSRTSCSDNLKHVAKKPRFIRHQKAKKATISHDELKATIRVMQHPSHPSAQSLFGDGKETPQNIHGQHEMPFTKPTIKPKPRVPPRPIRGVYKIGNGAPPYDGGDAVYEKPGPVYAAIGIDSDDSDYEN